jgi:hypothetical protein
MLEYIHTVLLYIKSLICCEESEESHGTQNFITEFTRLPI